MERRIYGQLNTLFIISAILLSFSPHASYGMDTDIKSMKDSIYRLESWFPEHPAMLFPGESSSMALSELLDTAGKHSAPPSNLIYSILKDIKQSKTVTREQRDKLAAFVEVNTEFLTEILPHITGGHVWCPLYDTVVHNTGGQRAHYASTLSACLQSVVFINIHDNKIHAAFDALRNLSSLLKASHSLCTETVGYAQFLVICDATALCATMLAKFSYNFDFYPIAAIIHEHSDILEYYKKAVQGDAMFARMVYTSLMSSKNGGIELTNDYIATLTYLKKLYDEISYSYDNETYDQLEKISIQRGYIDSPHLHSIILKPILPASIATRQRLLNACKALEDH
ncbi:MAG: hypothetical protein AB7E47_03760 [Desulfovibrionaceae bacterium]